LGGVGTLVVLEGAVALEAVEVELDEAVVVVALLVEDAGVGAVVEVVAAVAAKLSSSCTKAARAATCARSIWNARSSSSVKR
jgi:hypothetical protein